MMCLSVAVPSGICLFCKDELLDSVDLQAIILPRTVYFLDIHDLTLLLGQIMLQRTEPTDALLAIMVQNQPREGWVHSRQFSIIFKSTRNIKIPQKISSVQHYATLREKKGVYI